MSDFFDGVELICKETVNIPKVKAVNYFDRPEMSQSKLKVLLENPRIFYLEYVLGQRIQEKTTSMNFGTCLDLALTDIDKYNALEVKNTKTTKVEEFITKDWKTKIDYYITELHNYKFDDGFFEGHNFKTIITTCKKQEEIYYTYNDIAWKMKPDFLHVNNEFFIDLKSTKTTNYDDFVKDFVKYGYHIQASSYANGIKIKYKLDYTPLVYYIAISTVTGEIFALQCSQRLLELGMMEIDRGCTIYKENLISGDWGKNKKCQILDLPVWKDQQIVTHNNFKLEF